MPDNKENSKNIDLSGLSYQEAIEKIKKEGKKILSEEDWNYINKRSWGLDDTDWFGNMYRMQVFTILGKNGLLSKDLSKKYDELVDKNFIKDGKWQGDTDADPFKRHD